MSIKRLLISIGAWMKGSRLQAVLNEAQALWEQGDLRAALQVCDKAALQGGKARYEAALLRGDILRDAGDISGALSSYESVADPDLQDARVDCARGLALFELCRFAEAEAALGSAIRGDPANAQAYYTLGLIHELMGTGLESEHFRAARKYDPEHYPAPTYYTHEEFERLVQQAIQHVDPAVREGLRGVQTIIMDLPHPADLQTVQPPISPRTFGMLVGIVLQDEVDAPDITRHQRPAILLFKRNIERVCTSRQDLLEKLARTLAIEAGEDS
jgi:tetratricopeptide (TPR) repeat protein